MMGLTSWTLLRLVLLVAAVALFAISLRTGVATYQYAAIACVGAGFVLRFIDRRPPPTR